MAIGTMRMKAAAVVIQAPETSPQTPTMPTGRAALFCLAAALGSGALLWACYQPVALGTYLGWFALVPILLLVRTQTRPSFVYLFAFLGGLAFYVPALSWMRVAHSMMAAAWIALSIYMSLYLPIAIWMLRFFDRRNVALIVSVPLVIVALEYFRCIFLSGFPWYLLAHTQHDFLPMIQVSDLGGVFLVSIVVAAVNAFLFDCAYQFPEIRRWFNQTELAAYRYYSNVDLLNRGILAECFFRRNLLVEGTVLAMLLGGVYWYGTVRLGEREFATGPTVALLQSDLDQRLREGIPGDPDRQHAKKVVNDHFFRLCVQAEADPRPDLIVWPETSFPGPWYEVSPKLPIEEVPRAARDMELAIRANLKDYFAHGNRGIPHLLGLNGYRLEADLKERHFNTAVLLGADGEVKDGDKFDKIHRVPFGEYVPLVDWLPFLAYLSPYGGDFGVTPGEKMTRFKLDRHHFGVLICYEDTDPFLARRYVENNKDGPPVDFLVNISNDGWFDGSAEHEEHLAVCRFRAIECRRSMVRAVNMGVSAVIDSNGRVLKPTVYAGTSPALWMVQPELFDTPELPMASWRQFKKTAGVLKATVPIDRRASFYAVVGDVLPISAWLAIGATFVWALARRRWAPASRAA